jgi:hypothetical protein
MVMNAALSYLKNLWNSSYFSRPHTDCSGTWFNSHPACRDAESWNLVEKYLVNNGYLTVKGLSVSEKQALNLHPKDWNDMWWFEITEKGKCYVLNQPRA